MFDRINSDVRMTDAGVAYMETAGKLLDLEHQMENSFTDFSTYKTGPLIIETIVTTLQSIHPDMHLVVRVRTTAETVDGTLKVVPTASMVLFAYVASDVLIIFGIKKAFGEYIAALNMGLFALALILPLFTDVATAGGNPIVMGIIILMG